MRKPRRKTFEWILLVCAGWLIGLGLYFVFLRPVLLPEDLRYMGGALQEIQSAAPGFERWLHRVFTVMGGFMMGAGILLMHVVTSASDERGGWALLATSLAGVSTVGTMTLTNFQLDSDFKWLLLVPSLLWAFGVALYWRHVGSRA